MIGDIYTLKVDCLGNPAGTKGVSFNDYIDGEQLIFENGNYDGFSTSEKDTFLEFDSHSEIHEIYIFENVIKVSRDFEDGLWDDILKNSGII